MNGPKLVRSALAGALFAAGLSSAQPSAAFQLLQSFVNGWTNGPGISEAACNAPSGFLHWPVSNVSFRHNPAGQGWNKAGALYNALNGWNFVSGVTYTPTYAGTTTGTFGYDGVNSLSWGEDSGCTDTCIALTGLFIQQPGQILVESDVVFRQSKTWSISGASLDTWSVAAHEVGHTLGIAHSQFNSSTMWWNNFNTGLNWRSLEVDDGNALRCSQNRYPPANTCVPDGGVDDTNFANSCCSGVAVEGSTYCTNPADFNHGWASCHQVCGTPLVGGCVPSGGVDDIGSKTRCCSGMSVANSARCLNPADWNNGWKSCIQTCL